MKYLEVFVDDKSYDTEDGYTLICTTPYEISMAVETAIKNGFKDIRISEPTKENIYFYNKENKEFYDFEGVELKC